MKKGTLAAGIVLLLAAAGCTVVAMQQSPVTKRISECLGGGSCTEAEKAVLDINGDGAVTFTDLLLAKWQKLFPHGKNANRALCSPADAKQIGRTAYHADTGTLWCSLSGSGIEFEFTGSSCLVSLVGDSAAGSNIAVAPRYAVYLNGQQQTPEQLTEPTRLLTLQNPSGDSAACNVRIVKLSESMHSGLGIGGIVVNLPQGISAAKGDSCFRAAPAKQHLIEFLGDSITCGYGADGIFMQDVFLTANENAAETYAVLTAEALDADYSLVCYSGYGVLSGFGGGALNADALLPTYYGTVGRCSAELENGRTITEDLWDFSVQPDLIVVNLGTNDASYVGADLDRQREFSAKYTEFLKTLRQKNPDAPILCTLGIMGDALGDAIDLAVLNYQNETGDTKISTMRFALQEEADGYGVDWHPSPATHQKAADRLTAYIREWLGW